MDKETSQQNLTALQEMLLDEDKLVTYLTLSKDLCIHVNTSKALLYRFWEQSKLNGKGGEFSVSFLLSGINHESQGRTIVTPADTITDYENEMKQIFFKHVYSIMKSNKKVDDAAYSMVNSFEDFPLCVGLVRNEICSKRTADEISTLKTSSQDSFTKVTIPNVSSNIKQEKKRSSSKITEKAVGNGIKVEKIKAEVVSPKKVSVSPKKPVSPKNAGKQVKLNGKSQKGIAGFFSKQIATGTNKSPHSIGYDIKCKEAAVEEKSKISEKMEVDEQFKSDEKNRNKTRNESLTKEDKTSHKKETPYTKKLSQIKKTAKVDKKRKRVLKVSDSDSEDEAVDPFADNEPSEPANLSEDEIPPTPNITTIKVAGIVNPRKRRKIVDKTYTDEDGYILTKKEEIYESCSENDEEMSVKENIVNTNPKPKKETSPQQIKPTAKASKKKISPPQKGKQTSLENFFKKK